MLTKYHNHLPQQRFAPFFNSKSTPSHKLKNKRFEEMQKKIGQRRIFGEHFNYSKVGLNKEKKYMLEEERNTQIERANRILLQKIKRIGQRSYASPPTRTKTDEANPEYYQSNIKKNFITRKSTPFRSTHHNNTPSKISQFPTPRKVQHQTKIIYRGDKVIDGVTLSMFVYIQDDSYVIYSEQGNMEHKIQMSIDSYQMLLRESLNGKHLNIFRLLTFNGTMLALIGTKRKQVSIIEEEELELLDINKSFKKYRSNTTT